MTIPFLPYDPFEELEPLHEDNLIRAVWYQLLTERWQEEVPWSMWWRVFYACKFTVCVLARWLGRAHVRQYESLNLAILNQRSVWSMDCSNVYVWDALAVGEGVFRNWGYIVYSDTNC